MREHSTRQRLSDLRGWLNKKRLSIAEAAWDFKLRVRALETFRRRLPWFWMIATIVFVVPAVLLTYMSILPIELSAPIITVMSAVLLSELVRRISVESKRQREFGFLLWLIHHEMSAHLLYREDMLSSLKRGAKDDVKNGELLISAVPVSSILADAWEMFKTAGGLQTMHDYAPPRTVADLISYYYSVQVFNTFNTERQKLIHSSSDKPVRQLELVVVNMNGIGKAMVDLLEKEMPPLLADLTEEIQQVLLDLGQPFLWAGTTSGQHLVSEVLEAVVERNTRRDLQWRENRGLTHPRHMLHKDRFRLNVSTDNKKETP